MDQKIDHPNDTKGFPRVPVWIGISVAVVFAVSVGVY